LFEGSYEGQSIDDAIEVVKVQPRLEEDLTELLSYFEFKLNTEEFGCDAEYSIAVWDGGFYYMGEDCGCTGGLGDNYTYNNWGGVNATDALAIQLMASGTEISQAPYNYTWVGMSSDIAPYGFFSNAIADVNNSESITALDALTTNYRAVGLIANFPDNNPFTNNQFAPNFAVAGRIVESLPTTTFPDPFSFTNSNDFAFVYTNADYLYLTDAETAFYYANVAPEYTNNGSDVYMNIYYEAIGDVNASYIPPQTGFKAQPSVELEYNGMVNAHVGEEITIPVNIENDVEAGAITLDFNYRNDLIEVLGTNFDDENVNIDQNNGRLVIGWFDAKAKNLSNGDAVALIKVKVLSDIPAETKLFELNVNTEFADANAQPVENVKLKTIGVSTDNSVQEFAELSASNYPNPFRTSTTISYTLPENGKVKVEVYNGVGMIVKTLVDNYQEAGEQSVKFDANNVRSGVYLYRITVQGETNNYSAVKRMVVVH
jgi:hypothetical protein